MTQRRTHSGRHRLRLHGTPGALPRAGDAPRRRLHPAAVCKLRRNRERRPACNAFFDRLVRRGYAHEIRLRAQPRAGLSRPSQAAVFPHRRGVEPLSPAGVAAPRSRAPDAARRRPHHVGDVEWLTTAAEKAAYLERLKAESTVAATQPDPQATEATGAALPLSSALPIGVDVGRAHAAVCSWRASRRRRRSGASFRPMPRC